MARREFPNLQATQPMIDHGVGVFVAHIDDFELIGGPSMVSWLRGQGVRKIDVWHGTRGEYGKLFGKDADPAIVARRRRMDLRRAARATNYRGLIMRNPFPDGSLGRHQEELNHKVTNIVRRNGYGALFSFSRVEGPITPVFAHRDHTAIAVAAEMASEVADNAHEYIQKGVRPMRFRPESYGWETKMRLGLWEQYSKIPMTLQEVLDQVVFMGKHHADQFTNLEFLRELLLTLYKGEQKGTFRKLYNRLR